MLQSSMNWEISKQWCNMNHRELEDGNLFNFRGREGKLEEEFPLTSHVNLESCLEATQPCTTNTEDGSYFQSNIGVPYWPLEKI